MNTPIPSGVTTGAGLPGGSAQGADCSIQPPAPMTHEQDAAAQLIYERRILVQVLIYHQRVSISHCGCGWAELGASHAGHVADIYETALRYEGAIPDAH